jgi:endonuclease G
MDLFVFTGPIYTSEETKTIGANKVAVPTHLYKIVFAPQAQSAIAFVMPNIPLKTEDMPNYIVPIRAVVNEDLGDGPAGCLDQQSLPKITPSSKLSYFTP